MRSERNIGMYKNSMILVPSRERPRKKFWCCSGFWNFLPTRSASEDLSGVGFCCEAAQSQRSEQKTRAKRETTLQAAIQPDRKQRLKTIFPASLRSSLALRVGTTRRPPIPKARGASQNSGLDPSSTRRYKSPNSHTNSALSEQGLPPCGHGERC